MSAEIPRQGGTNMIGDQLLRRAEGGELFALFNRLEPFSGHPLIDLPADEHGQPDPKVIAVSNRELGINHWSLDPVVDMADDFLPELYGRVPGAAEPVEGVVTAGLDWSRPRRNTHERYHYLSLLFSDEMTARLRTEQRDIRTAIEAMAGTDEKPRPLQWNPTQPMLLVVSLERGLSDSVIGKMRSYVKENGRLDLTLRPMGEARRDVASRPLPMTR